MILRKSWLILMLVALMALWGCSDDDDGPAAPGQTAFEHMAEVVTAVINDNTITPRVIGVDALYNGLQENPPAYTVIDVRAVADYNAGHIPGAYHSTLATLLTDLETTIPSDKPYVLTCYTGQSAGHAKVAMQLMGYEPVYSLGWGMCSWNSTLASRWTNNCANNLATPETTDQNPNLVTHDFPVLDGTPSTVVATRVAAMLAGGFKGISFTAMSAAGLDDYFIVNYHSRADYLGENVAVSGVPGHIPGAFQFTPYQSLGVDQMLNNLPTDQPVVVYCWSGQHSSQVAALLNILGYEAYSMTYGVNNLFHDQLIQNKWNEATMSRDYPLEVVTQ